MSESSITLCLLSYLLMLSLSVCHTVVKRKAPDGQLYVFSKTEGCVSVQSEEPCPLSWQLNPYLAKVYRQQSEVINTTIKFYEDSGINDRCIQAMKRTLCSQLIPRCSADGIRDYGGVSTLCRDFRNSCPQQIQVKVNCQRLKTGKHPSMRCVSPPTSFRGVCPQPEFKMLDELLTNYQQKSVNLATTFAKFRNLRYRDTGEGVFSSKCLSELEDIQCSPIYCSANESLLLIKHDQNDCKKIIKECYEEFILKTSSSSSPSVRREAIASRKNMMSNCETFPVTAAQLEPEPVTAAQLEPEPVTGAPLEPEPSAANCLHITGRSIPLLAVYFLIKIFI